MDPPQSKEDRRMMKRILVGLGGTPYTSVAIERAFNWPNSTTQK